MIRMPRRFSVGNAAVRCVLPASGLPELRYPRPAHRSVFRRTDAMSSEPCCWRQGAALWCALRRRIRRSPEWHGCGQTNRYRL